MPVGPLQGDLDKVLGFSPLPSKQQRGPQQAPRPGAHEVLERHLRLRGPHTHLYAATGPKVESNCAKTSGPEACDRRRWAPWDTTFHDLRHTFASTALAEGVPISEVSRWLGHKSITTTVDLYGHLVPEASGRARDALDNAFRPARVCPESAPAAP